MANQEASFSQLQMRETKSSYDTLYKEMNKKDRRNDLLTKELKEARMKRDELQKDFNTLGMLFEKMNKEKYSLANEVKKYKGMELERTVEDAASGKALVKKLEYTIYSKDRTISELEEQIRQLQTSKEYRERSLSRIGRSEEKEDVIESLCDELGRNKSEAHGLALSLAEIHQQLLSSQTEVSRSRETNADYYEKMRYLEDEVARLARIKSEQMTEILTLHKQNMAEVETNARSTKLVEDLTSRLSDERNKASSTASELQRKYSSVVDELEECVHERDVLADRLSDLELNHQNLLSMFKLSEEIISRERARCTELEVAVSEKEGLVEDLEYQLDSLDKNLEQSTSSNEQFSALFREFGLKQKAWDQERDTHRKRVDELLREVDELKAQREEGLLALRNTVDAVKEMSVKLAVEQESKLVVEEENRELRMELEKTKRSQSQVTTAVLDALNKEKSRSLSLERTLQEILPPSESERNFTQSPPSRFIEGSGLSNFSLSRGDIMPRSSYPPQTQSSLAYAGSDVGSYGPPNSIHHMDANISTSCGVGYTAPSPAVRQLQALVTELRRMEDGVPSPLSNTRSTQNIDSQQDSSPLNDSDSISSSVSAGSDDIPINRYLATPAVSTSIYMPVVSPFDESHPSAVRNIAASILLPRRREEISLFDIVDADIYEEDD